MKNTLLLLLFSIPIKIYCCEPIEVKEILSFYSSKYVFEGKIISKIYAKDSLTYTITFDIYKHYKKSNIPKRIKMKFEAEGEYTGIFTSCDWSCNVGEKWLVFAHKNNSTLFYNMGVNSRRIEKSPITKHEKSLFEKANSFNIKNYIYMNNSNPFNYCKNLTNINLILKQGKNKKYKKGCTVLYFLINEKGKLKSVRVANSTKFVLDPTFNLIIKMKNEKKIPVSTFEKDAIKLMSRVKKWEIKKHPKTGIAVSYITHLWVYYDNSTNKWSFKY